MLTVVSKMYLVNSIDVAYQQKHAQDESSSDVRPMTAQALLRVRTFLYFQLSHTVICSCPLRSSICGALSEKLDLLVAMNENSHSKISIQSLKLTCKPGTSVIGGNCAKRYFVADRRLGPVFRQSS